jgi:hypothetical protein
MKKSAVILAGWLALSWGLSAQVKFGVFLEQEQYLRNESLPTHVSITNFSGQMLRFGPAADWLTFEIRDAQGHVVAQVAPLDLDVVQMLERPAGDGGASRAAPAFEQSKVFNLPSAKVASLTIDLMPYFDLSKPGQYTLSAHLKVALLDQLITCHTKPFNIINGSVFWEREFGLPGTGGREARKYALLHANLGQEVRLYLRVTDATGHKVIRVRSLGPLLTIAKPEYLLDRSSNLHILYQSGARTFLYHVIGPDGETIIRQTHEFFGASRPTLRHIEEQAVIVAGGVRHHLASDLPPPPPDNNLESLLPLDLHQTNLPPKTAPPTKGRK